MHDIIYDDLNERRSKRSVPLVTRHQGGVVLVSHDDRLVSMVADELWVVTPGPSKEVPGKVTVFEGSFEASRC